MTSFSLNCVIGMKMSGLEVLQEAPAAMVRIAAVLS
jgi:hypothetical protein